MAIRNKVDYFFQKRPGTFFSIYFVLGILWISSIVLSVVCPPAALAIGFGVWSLIGNIIPLVFTSLMGLFILSTVLTQIPDIKAGGRRGRRAHKALMLNELIENGNLDYLAQDNVKTALLRLYDIRKDLRDSITRYKSPSYIGRDILQPLHGFYSIGRGLVQLMGLPFLLVFMFGSFLFEKRSSDGLKKPIRGRTETALGILADSTALILHGLEQTIKAPFTLALQIPFRLALTAFKGFKPVQENSGILALKAKFFDTVSRPYPKTTNILEIFFQLQEKHQKARSCGQKSINDNVIISEKVKKFFSMLPSKAPLNDLQTGQKPSLLNYEKRFKFFNAQHATPLLFGVEVPNIEPESTLAYEARDAANTILSCIYRSN